MSGDCINNEVRRVRTCLTEISWCLAGGLGGFIRNRAAECDGLWLFLTISTENKKINGSKEQDDSKTDTGASSHV